MITVEENGIGGFGSHGGPSTQPASHLSTPLADALHAADQAPAITMMAESLMQSEAACLARDLCRHRCLLSFMLH